MNADLSMHTRPLNCHWLLAVLRRIRHILWFITQPVLQSLVVALVLSCLDYSSTVLFGLPQQLVDRLQFVQNATVQLIVAAHLHWMFAWDTVLVLDMVLSLACHCCGPA